MANQQIRDKLQSIIEFTPFIGAWFISLKIIVKFRRASHGEKIDVNNADELIRFKAYVNQNKERVLRTIMTREQAESLFAASYSLIWQGAACLFSGILMVIMSYNPDHFGPLILTVFRYGGIFLFVHFGVCFTAGLIIRSKYKNYLKLFKNILP